MYDAIVVPGGGVTPTGEPTACVKARLEAAIAVEGTAPILCLSAGTTHRPPPLNSDGTPIFEATAGLRFLQGQGIAVERLFAESSSYDTIGNALFARLLHTEPRGWRQLLVITSEFHAGRTKAIFDVVFGLPFSKDRPADYRLEYRTVPNVGLVAEDIAARCEKERNSEKQWKATVEQNKFRSLADLHRWLFSEHAAYAFGLTSQRATGPVINSY